MIHSLQRERITRYMQDAYGSEAEHPWTNNPNDIVFRHPASRKWYAVVMRVRPAWLGLPGEQALDMMNVKCSPIMIGSLLSTKGFRPAYHMNKNHWISIVLDDSVSDSQITSLLELSYESATPKQRKKCPQPTEE